MVPNCLPYPTGVALPEFMSSVTTSVNCYPTRPAPVVGSKDTGFTLSFGYTGPYATGLKAYLFGTGGVSTGSSAFDDGLAEPLAQDLTYVTPSTAASNVDFGLVSTTDGLGTHKVYTSGSKYYMRFGSDASLPAGKTSTSLAAVVCHSVPGQGNLCTRSALKRIAYCSANPLINGGLQLSTCPTCPAISSATSHIAGCGAKPPQQAPATKAQPVLSAHAPCTIPTWPHAAAFAHAAEVWAADGIA